MHDNYNILIQKLDAFIRKYYTNQLLRGVLFTTAILLVFFLIVVIGEYIIYFSSTVRKLFFYSFLTTSIGLISFFIVLPILKINRLGDIISYDKAADIIGRHFKNVEDKLLNILQLKQASLSLTDASLIDASINQKSLELKPIPFVGAIDFSSNKKYLKYTIPPLLLFFSILIFRPKVISESTTRLVNNNTIYEKPMPFSFIVDIDSLEVLQFDDFKLDIKIEGEEIPNEVFIVKNDIKQSTQRLNSTNFAYVFTNLQEEVTFHLEANGFRSKEFTLDVLQKPMITKFQVELDYPEYILQKDEIVENSGDLTVPEGTKIEWLFDAIGTDEISMQFSDALFVLKKSSNNQYYLHKEFKNSDKYILKTSNNIVGVIDSSQFNISVILDEYPEISVEEYIDSTNDDQYFYIGKVSDDYGVRALTFSYKIERVDKDSISSDYITENISFSNGIVSEFYHYWNIKSLDLKPGDKINYFFTVWDNDGVNGSKSSRSKWMTYALPSVEEFEDKSEEEFEEILEEIGEVVDEAQELQEELKKFQQKLIDKKELSWEDKKQLEDMLSKQKAFEEAINNIENKLDKNIDEQSEFKEVSDDIKKKQEQVQKLFDEVLDDETKELIEKLERMMEELSKDNVMEELDNMEVNDEELEKELDRMLELLKKLEFEQKMTETIEKLEELAEKQEELAKQSRDKNANKDELKKEQEKINEQFDELSKDLDELSKMNDELDGMDDMSDLQEKSDDIKEQQSQSMDKLDKGQNQKANENQKNAAQKMSEMAEQMSSMMQSSAMESMEEDMESLRQLLENLVKLSFAQEKLIDEFKTISINTPRYISLVQEQYKLIDDSKMVEDSLFSLAKRVFQIESFITDEILEVNRNLDKSVEELEERKVNNALVNQQYVMTGYNNLALLLSEVMEQMQQQMAQQMPGNQSCEKPGNKPGKKPGKIPSISEMQQQLNDKMQQMQEMKEKGSSPGGTGMSSKQMAEMAAKQQAIRQALEQINESENKDGKGSLGDLQEIIDEMEQIETDLVNKRITNEMIDRQQDIMVKLLEAEEAEKQRGEKNEREAVSATKINTKTPPSLEEYLKKREASIDVYKSLPPSLKPYYKNISEKYYENIFKID